MGDTVRATEIVAGDEVTLPGSPLGRCRVQLVRTVEPEVVWLYLLELSTGRRVRGHVAVPADGDVVRHGHCPTDTPLAEPEDS